MSLAEFGSMLEMIDAVSSKDGKASELSKRLVIPEIRALLDLSLNAYRTYGMKAKTLPDFDGMVDGCGSSEGVDYDFKMTLGYMESRTLTGNGAQNVMTDIWERASWWEKRAIQAILDKDLRCGMSISSVNKTLHRDGHPKIPDFKCQLADKFDEKKFRSFKRQSLTQLKYDGMRCLAFISRSVDGAWTVDLKTRTGHSIDTCPHITKQLAQWVGMTSHYQGEDPSKNAVIMELVAALNTPDGIVLDGELMAEDFLETLKQVRKTSEIADENVFFRVFDILPGAHFKNENIWARGAFDRWTALVGLSATRSVEFSDVTSKVKLADTWIHFIGDQQDVNEALNCIMELNAEMQAAGHEGLIVKDPDGKYLYKRSDNWMKLKAKGALDLPVIAVEYGDPKSKLAGIVAKLIVLMPDGHTTVAVGSGLTDVLRECFTKDPDDIIGRIVEIEYHEITPDGSLRHPRFKRIRDDKCLEDGPGV